jgi:hypothetical protein
MSNSIGNNGDVPLVNYYKNLVNQQEQANKNRIEDIREGYEKKLDQVQEIHLQDREKAEQRLRKLTEEVSADYLENARQQREDLLKELEYQKAYNYNNRGQVPMISEKLHQEHIKQMEDAYQQALASNEEAVAVLEKEKGDNIKALSDQSKQRLVRQANEFKQQVSDLEARIKEKEKIAAQEVLAKEMDKNRELALGEADKKLMVQSLGAAFDLEKQKLRDALDQKDEYYGARQKEALESQQELFSKIVDTEKKEREESLKSLQQRYSKVIEDQQADAAHERQVMNRQLENQIQRSEATQNLVLNKQSEAQAQEIEHLTENFEFEKKHMEANLDNARKNTLVDVSVDLEANLRAAIVQEYEKAMQTEVKRNRQMMEAYAENIKEPLYDLAKKNQVRESQLMAESAHDRYLTATQMQEAYEELQNSSTLKLKDQEYAFEKEQKNIVKHFEKLLDRQRREYMSMLDDLGNKAETRVLELQKESDLAGKGTHREYIRQLNDQARDYERKLVDQKAEYEDKIEDIQQQVRSETKEVEKRSRSELEATIDVYEKKIAQLETQFKDRERNLSQKFEDELDRIRRAYESTKKKG